MYYPFSIQELDYKRRMTYNQNLDLNKKVYCMYETDGFFESDQKIIKDHYMPKESNKRSVAELIYEFFYFYVNDYDSSNMVINIKETGSEAL